MSSHVLGHGFRGRLRARSGQFTAVSASEKAIIIFLMVIHFFNTFVYFLSVDSANFFFLASLFKLFYLMFIWTFFKV